MLYSSVASRESIRIGFLLAALNGLDVIACGIRNIYLNAPNREKVHVVVGKQLFGRQHEGKRDDVVRILYGLKFDGVSWRDMFANTIKNKLGYKR